MNNRHSQLVLIEKRVEKANEQINSVIQKLGLTRQELQQWQKKQEKIVCCPFNKRHEVSQSNIKEHYRRCLLKSRGAKVEKKITKLPSSLFFYKEAKSVISFLDRPEVKSDEYKNRIDIISVPQQTHYIKELEPIPSITEKCQAYDHVIQRSNQLRKDHKTFIISDEIDRQILEKKKNNLKKLEQQNKKKNKKYRIKMKMITPTEIQRELIHAYMQQYK